MKEVLTLRLVSDCVGEEAMRVYDLSFKEHFTLLMKRPRHENVNHGVAGIIKLPLAITTWHFEVPLRDPASLISIQHPAPQCILRGSGKQYSCLGTY